MQICKIDHTVREMAHKLFGIVLLIGGLISFLEGGSVLAAEPGVTETTIRVGATMPLGGDSELYGLNMKKGIEAALANQIVQGRKVELEVVNNFDEHITTIEVVKPLIDKGIFVMLGHVGTLTSLKLIPLLAGNEIPAVGFYMAGPLETKTEDEDTSDIDPYILNFRPGHIREVTTIVAAATDAGIKAPQICMFAQNDADGLAGVDGLKSALAKLPNAQTSLQSFDKIIEMMWGGINPALNNMGPVGLYLRGTTLLREGHQSLKNWEKNNGEPCRLVILVATPKVAADFIAYASYKNENWIFSAISATAAGDALKNRLLENNIQTKVIVSQIVPVLDGNLPIVTDARNALGSELNLVNLEGFIVGRMFLNILRSMNGPVTRANFLKAARRQSFDLGGLKIDFTKGNQGSSLVLLRTLNVDKYAAFSAEDMKR
jgi:branched-chain amino acid transport system substrate-binding protein